ncbi:MAG: DegT/DnrJ/EryC1/StrS aminotransferase family protein [Oligosphaeraceae bacterium]|nr:DegT/DnrJ/EryC1/StrS aminotransferase family protein [Oligosphaeraceae bacterium]
MSTREKLAINGGPKAIPGPLPPRGHFGKEEQAAANRLFEKSIASGSPFGYHGEEEEQFGQEFAAFLGGGYADGVNSGTNAVYVALRALDLPPFSEVIVGAITDPGGIMPIVMNACIPVIADTAPGQYNTGPAEIAAVLTPLPKPSWYRISAASRPTLRPYCSSLMPGASR